MTSDEAYQEAWEENRMWLGQDDELFKSGWKAALSYMATQQEPVFWYRPRSDDGYEGPIHNSAIEKVRTQSGVWIPLFAHPAPAQPAVVQQLIEAAEEAENCLYSFYAGPEWASEDFVTLQKLQDALKAVKG